MNEPNHIKAKLLFWAKQNAIKLIGSQITKGKQMYCQNPSDNFFLFPCKDTILEIKNGDGQEFGNGFLPGKIQALHSSSAFGVNFFEYWRHQKEKSILAKGLKIPSNNISEIHFEQKYPVLNVSNKAPNIDVILKYTNESVCAIECKFTEPYSGRKESKGLNLKYIKDPAIWGVVPHLYKYSMDICPIDSKNTYFDAPQLIKHTLGLLKYYKNNKNRFRLLYLWYDAFGEQGNCHREEIEQYQAIMWKDNINFQHITWQELIINLIAKYYVHHKAYFNYLYHRYL